MITKEIYQQLNKKEKIVYTYVEKNKDKVSYMNIRDLAYNCGVSTTTILRFIHKLNFDSYKEFKFWCRNKDEREEFSYHTKEVIECLEKLENPIFEERLEEAVSIIKNCEFVLFEGIGNSGGTALLGARYFSNFGYFSLSLNDPFYNFEVLPKNMAVIILSSSGETPEIIAEVENFIKFNIPIIAITSSEESTLAQLSDLTLSYYLRQQRKDNTFDMSSQIPAVHIIEKMANKLKNNNMLHLCEKKQG